MRTQALIAVTASLLLSACYGHTRYDPPIVHQHPGTTVVVSDSIEYLTYKERYGGYTMTPYGYVPLDRIGHHGLRMATPGYTYSKSIYWDQRPEAHGIYPARRRKVHVVTSGNVEYHPSTNYARLGCVINSQGYPHLREYNTQANVGGRMVPVYGTVCQTPDNGWRVVSELKPVR